MKTLSVRQPYASLVCYGIKTVENRTWKTDYRGRVLIHAGGKHVALFDYGVIPQDFQNKYIKHLKDELDCPKDAPDDVKAMHRLTKDMWKFYGVPWEDDNLGKYIKEAVKKCGFFFRAASIIGEVELVDVIDARHIGTLRKSDDVFAAPRSYHWILRNPVLYEKPITNVMGRLRLWDFDIV